MTKIYTVESASNVWMEGGTTEIVTVEYTEAIKTAFTIKNYIESEYCESRKEFEEYENSEYVIFSIWENNKQIFSSFFYSGRFPFKEEEQKEFIKVITKK